MMKRKKILALLMGFMLAGGAMAGCSSNIPKAPPSSQEPASSQEAPSEQEPDEGAGGDASEGWLKTGYAVITSVGDSKDAGDADGLAKADSTIVAVTVDGEGKIAGCVIDGVQVSINFTKEGKISTDKAGGFPTKRELGEGYGLKKASSIGREWNEQADAFAAYVIGKTVEEVKGIALSEGVPADAELASSVTIHVGDFIGAVEQAVANARELGAKAGDKLGMGITTNIASSADAGEKEGVAQAYSTYAIATFGPDGGITSSIIDATQANVTFDASGKITADLSAKVQTKVQLGEAYGMKKASAIGKEWGEQAEAYAAYIVGKSLDEVKGIAVSEGGAPSGAELASSVTIGIGDFNAALEKAVANAK